MVLLRLLAIRNRFLPGSPTSHWPGRYLHNYLLDEVCGENSLLLLAGSFIFVFAVVPVGILDGCDGDGFIRVEAEVVVMPGSVVVEGFDFERWIGRRRGHGGGGLCRVKSSAIRTESKDEADAGEFEKKAPLI